MSGLSICAVGSVISTQFVTEGSTETGPNSLQTDIIGHRGFSGKYKDNSIEGFKQAEAVGVDGFELDIRVTKDNKILLSHDPFVIDGSEAPALIRRTSLTELQSIDPQLITIDTFLNEFGNEELLYYLDLKDPDGAQQTIQKFSEYGLKENIILSSFQLSILNQYRESDIQTALVSPPEINPLTEQAIQIDTDYIIPHYDPYTKFVEEEVNIKFGYWLLNENESDIENALSQNIDVFICNRPDLIFELNNET
jgi:glycerophosphoryl diester phosphodiesterase